MKRKCLILLCFGILGYCCSLFAMTHPAEEGVKQNIIIEPVEGLSEDFMRGVDISSLYEIEANGGKYYNANREEEDLFKILAENGVNWVRLRVWNNPKDGGGSNNVDIDVKLAVRAKQAGLKLLVDFHYSDTWADPGKQPMPAEWKKLNEKQLNAAVEKYTKESIEAFIKAGARPDAVQIGNELNNGFMWPLGKIWGNDGEKVGGFKGFTELLKSAAAGVRAAQGNGQLIKIIIHIADGGNNDLYRAVLDPVTKAKVDFDIIGLSFYTYWHGSCTDLKRNMADLAKRYGKEMAVMETAYAFTKEDGDEQGNVFMVYSGDNDGYLPSVQGQATAVRDVIETVANIKGGIGVFYWEPAWIPVEGAGLSKTEGDTWENQCMFDFEGRALPSLAVWNLVYGNDRGAVSNVWGGSAKNGGGFIPYDMADPLKITTMPGVDPILPKMVKVVYTNDKENNVIVSWEKHDWVAETTPRIMEISAGLSGSSYRVKAEIEISSRINLVEDNSWESGKLGKWKLNGSDTACYVENNKSNSHTGKWTYKYWLGQGFKSVLTQDFKGIENGTYVMTVWAMGGGGENDIRFFAANYDGNKTQLSTQIVNTGWLNWKQYKVEAPVTNHQITVGIYLDTNAGNWGNFDDVELYLKENTSVSETSQEWDDSFTVNLNTDFTDEISDEPAADGASGKMANVLQGIWIEATSKTNAIIRDIATGEKAGWELDNQHLLSNANWWFWGDINKTFHLDAEIGVWKFDRTLYQADSFAANVPVVTWGDGLQGLGTMFFSPIYNWNDNGLGAFNKLGFTISSPFVNVKVGYGGLKENGMSEFTGIYNVIDRWLDVGKGFTEISNGKKLQRFGDVKVNAMAALSMMRGTYGMYDILDVKFGEDYRTVATFGSKTTAEQLFYYNSDNLNAASLYFIANPGSIKLEAHGLTTFGTGLDYGASTLAGAVRAGYSNDVLEVSVKGSWAGKNVNSVWGSDGQIYDDINADTVTGKVDVNWQPKEFIAIGLDETITFNNVEALSDGLMNIRTQPILDFYLEPLAGFDFTASTYAVMNFDRLATATSVNRDTIFSFKEAGIELTAKDISYRLKKLVFDYALSFDFQDWKDGSTYDIGVTYNSFMLSADVSDNLNLHAGTVLRNKSEKDAAFVPLGFALGAKFASVPLPGSPALWMHFCYGMNPYSENNYSLYRADNWMNKTPHRTYLLNSLYEDYTTSQIGIGFIWNIQ